MYFSKSKYTQGVQCPKILWMQRNMPEQFDASVLDEVVLKNGSFVGDVAMGYYGPYIEVPFDHEDPKRFEKAIIETQYLLERGERTICEATFGIPGHYCMVDILLVRDDGLFDIVEVKSSSEMKPIYYHDLAYQCWLVEQCGYVVNSASLMHVNTSYVREGELDLQGLFEVEDHTEEIRMMMPSVASRLERVAAIVDSVSEPEIPIGLQCFNPYKCGFRQWCFRRLPQNNAFGLSRISMKKAVSLVERGCPGFEDIVNDAEAFEKLTAKQQLQVIAEVNGFGPVIDRDAVRLFLSTLSYPLYFLDFESFQEAIPSFDRQKPYEQMASQYSLHWIDGPEGALHHAEFLGHSGEDPRRDVAEHLCRDIPADACVLAWNMSFEKGRIGRMAELYPDLAEHLMAIYRNIRDLMAPFQQGAYYMKEMEGSYSIKKVLPALFPNEPELDYHALGGVENGSQAADAFLRLADLSDDEQKDVREQLLRYCELDTLAMVRIWEKLMLDTSSPVA